MFQDQVRDHSTKGSAKRSIMGLWDLTGGDFSQVPDDYVEQFNYEFSDGTVSLLSQITKVQGVEDMSREEFSELVDHMISVNPEDWPEFDGIEEIVPERAFGEQPQFEPMEFDFAEDGGLDGAKVEELLRRVIGTVYRDGVARVVDKSGKPPQESNSFLMTEDGGFEGIFVTAPRDNGNRDKYPFRISQKSEGEYQISY